VYIAVLQYVAKDCIASVECLSSEIDYIESEKYVSLFSYDMCGFFFVDIKCIDKCMDFLPTGIMIFVDEVYFFCDAVVEIVYRKWFVYVLMHIKSIK